MAIVINPPRATSLLARAITALVILAHVLAGLALVLVSLQVRTSIAGRPAFKGTTDSFRNEQATPPPMDNLASVSSRNRVD